MTMADKIVVLRDGRIEQVGKPLELYNTPANRFVAGFIGSPRMNFIPAQVGAGQTGHLQVRCEGLAPLALNLPPDRLPETTSVTVGVRPEHLVPGADGDWPLRVGVIEQLGNTSFVHGSLPSGAPLSMALSGQTRIEHGDRIKRGLGGGDGLGVAALQLGHGVIDGPQGRGGDWDQQGAADRF
jgi:ABC-type sugar transport system ATPase subunit